MTAGFGGHFYLRHKSRNTALKRRLGQIAVFIYGFIFLARFALSCAISALKY